MKISKTLMIATLLMLYLSGGYAQSQLGVTEVIFSESEPGVEPYKSRLLLNDDYLRLDDGSDDGDFILFDRDSGEVHSFNHEDETHMQIRPKKAEPVEFNLNYRVDKKVLSDAPSINGQKPTEYRYIANGQECLFSVNVKGLLSEMAQVLVRYEQTLVEQSIPTLSKLPASQKTACYMANNFLHASEYLKDGFPLQVEDYQGRKKKLSSFQKIHRPQSLFQFPKGYRQYDPSVPDSVHGFESKETANQ